MTRSGGGCSVLALMLVLGLMPSGSGADEPKAKSTGVAKKADDLAARERDARKSAEVFLIQVDKGQYAQSWDGACEWFKKGITRPKWIDGLNATRKPLGRLRARKLNRIEMKASENPDRIDQAWIYSDIQFASGQTFTELIIVFHENGKEWRTSGYFIGSAESLPKPPAKPSSEPAK